MVACDYDCKIQSIVTRNLILLAFLQKLEGESTAGEITNVVDAPEVGTLVMNRGQMV